MGNPGAQHELACTLVQRYPHLAVRLGEMAGVKFPDRALAVAGSNSHQLPDRPPLEGDGTIRFLAEGKAVSFVQVEVQQKHTEDKYATLRAYHGSEVSKARVGGHMFVLSPKEAEAAKFRRSESRFGADFDYQGSYMSRTDLEPMAEAGQPFEERCLSIGMTDFSQGVPAVALAMLREAADTDSTIANLFFRTITEEVTDVTMMEAVMEEELLQKLRGLKAWRDYEERIEKQGEAKGKAEAEAQAEAKIAQTEAKVARAAIAAKADDLTQFFLLRGDKPSVYGLNQIDACTDADQLSLWLRRAYAGETAAEIFPEPEA